MFAVAANVVPTNKNAMSAVHRFSLLLARTALAALLLSTQLLSAQNPANKPRRVPRSVWNFDGGVFLQTDGSVNEHTCFRLAGRMVEKDFFDNLKRVDDNQGTQYLRGKESVTEFPDHISLQFVIHDFPCPSQLHDGTGRQYLTREMMRKLRLSLFWKRGIDLRPTESYKVSFFSVNPVPPYAKTLASELPEKLEWSYALEIPSKDVPLTDSLVLIFRRDDGHIAARVAARL